MMIPHLVVVDVNSKNTINTNTILELLVTFTTISLHG
jgi:hypothetical protein